MEMKSLWPEDYITFSTQVISTNTVNNYVIERIHAKESRNDKDNITNYLKCTVAYANLNF